MANANTFQGRIAHKIDTAENWSKATGFKPLPGELVLYDKDDEHDYIRAKIGDGENFVTDLPFADASIWAELANKQPVGDYATKDYVDSGDEIPFFDLVEMGMPELALSTNQYDYSASVTLDEESITLIKNAAERGAAKFKFLCAGTEFTIKTNHAYVSQGVFFNSMVQMGMHLFNCSIVLSGGDIYVGVTRVFSAVQVNEFVENHNLDSDSHSDIRAAIPTTTSQLTNDSGYLTEHQSLEGYATETYVQNLIETSLVEGAW